MNSTGTTPWSAADIAQFVNLAITGLVALLSAHQSYRHRYLTCTVCGKTCLELSSDNNDDPA